MLKASGEYERQVGVPADLLKFDADVFSSLTELGRIEEASG